MQKMPPVKKCQAEQPADTNQVGSNFHRQPATSDNPDNRPYISWYFVLPFIEFPMENIFINKSNVQGSH